MIPRRAELVRPAGNGDEEHAVARSAVRHADRSLPDLPAVALVPAIVKDLRHLASQLRRVRRIAAVAVIVLIRPLLARQKLDDVRRLDAADLDADAGLVHALNCQCPSAARRQVAARVGETGKRATVASAEVVGDVRRQGAVREGGLAVERQSLAQAERDVRAVREVARDDQLRLVDAASLVVVRLVGESRETLVHRADAHVLADGVHVRALRQRDFQRRVPIVIDGHDFHLRLLRRIRPRRHLHGGVAHRLRHLLIWRGGRLSRLAYRIRVHRLSFDGEDADIVRLFIGANPRIHPARERDGTHGGQQQRAHENGMPSSHL